jgi:hypothetical protein
MSSLCILIHAAPAYIGKSCTVLLINIVVLMLVQDYGDPQKWGDPAFVAFVVAVCCLASRHIDDPRVRASPNDGVSSGTMWFNLFNSLRTLPGGDRPTLYTIQATLVAGIYAIRWGKLSKPSHLSPSPSLSLDAGLHRSTDAYDIFDAFGPL